MPYGLLLSWVPRQQRGNALCSWQVWQRYGRVASSVHRELPRGIIQPRSSNKLLSLPGWQLWKYNCVEQQQLYRVVRCKSGLLLSCWIDVEFGSRLSAWVILCGFNQRPDSMRGWDLLRDHGVPKFSSVLALHCRTARLLLCVGIWCDNDYISVL